MMTTNICLINFNLCLSSFRTNNAFVQHVSCSGDQFFCCLFVISYSLQYVRNNQLPLEWLSDAKKWNADEMRSYVLYYYANYVQYPATNKLFINIFKIY